MFEILLAEHGKITKEIEKEKRENMDRIVMSFAAFCFTEQENDKDNILETRGGFERDHKIAMLSLLCIRIAVNCQLLHEGYYANKSELQNDISNLIEYVGSIKYEWEITDSVVYDALDIMSAICPSYVDIIKENITYKLSGYLYKENMISPELYYLFNVVWKYYERIGRNELAYTLMERLCTISRQRNSLELHREIIARVLGSLSDKAPEISCKIGNLDKEIYEGVENEYAGEFFWFYACSLRDVSDAKNAVVFYKKCYEVRKKLYGSNNWYTVIAKREFYINSWTISKEKVGLDFLLTFIDNIENGQYAECNADMLAIIEGNTLYFLLMECSDIENFHQYNRYLELYEKICIKYNHYDEPLIKLYLAKNLRGGYLFKVGNYIEAESAFMEALSEKMTEETVEILTEAQIKSNLLMVYYMQNDLEQVFPLLRELLGLIEDEHIETGFTIKDEYRIYILLVSIEIQTSVELDQEEIDELKNVLKESFQDINENSSELIEYARELATFILCAILLLLQNGGVSKEEQKMYLDILNKIENFSVVFPLYKHQWVLLYYVSAILSWRLSNFGTEMYIKKSVYLSGNSNIPISARAAIFQMAAAYYAQNGSYHRGSKYLEKVFNELTALWQSYVRYLNDMRLIQILALTQITFSESYAILRKNVGIDAAYEKILQFKALASLAGRERNRILRTGKIDQLLLHKIQILQDKIASLEAENIFRDTSEERGEEEEALRKLEVEFARQFPKDICFTDITWENVKEAIPNDATVLEYFFNVVDYERQNKSEISEEEEIEIDVYITCKKKNQCKLNRVTVPCGETILEKAHEFLEILQAEADMSVSIEQLSKSEEIRMKLYKALIEPVLPYIGETATLYIAPDNELINLPFEILCDEKEEKLDDYYDVIKIECARDFLFDNSDYPSWKKNLIIGNPEYDVRERSLGEAKCGTIDRGRGCDFGINHIQPLPFSELEVKLIGKHSDSPYFCGYEATKGLLLSAQGYEIIHVATHGSFDLSDEKESMYSSCLMFTGVLNWLRTGEISEVYGNGIVTADEISRMDLRSAKLVVLSSCLSGMSEVFRNKGFHGMVGALSAAGAHYVISNLWAANDFSTAILMDEFYYQYTKMKCSPSIALRLAKKYLKNITIGQLKQQGWFSFVKQSNFDRKVKEMISKYEQCNDRIKPFKNEAYWGGFTCYKCN